MSDQGTQRVLTMGYGGRTADEVLSALASHDVERVVDVRAVAESSTEGFSGEELADTLATHGLSYHHLGELGDYQPEPYHEYMETEVFGQEYDRLVDLVRGAKSCLLCRCPDVGACHRRFLQQRLVADGFKVVHLTPAGPREAVTFDGA